MSETPHWIAIPALLADLFVNLFLIALVLDVSGLIDTHAADVLWNALKEHGQ